MNEETVARIEIDRTGRWEFLDEGLARTMEEALDLAGDISLVHNCGARVTWQGNVLISRIGESDQGGGSKTRAEEAKEKLEARQPHSPAWREAVFFAGDIHRLISGMGGIDKGNATWQFPDKSRLRFTAPDMWEAKKAINEILHIDLTQPMNTDHYGPTTTPEAALICSRNCLSLAEAYARKRWPEAEVTGRLVKSTQSLNDQSFAYYAVPADPTVEECEQAGELACDCAEIIEAIEEYISRQWYEPALWEAEFDADTWLKEHPR